MITDSLPYAFDDPATVQLLRGIAEIGEMAEVMLTLLPLRSAAEAEDPADVETRQAKMSGDSLVDDVPDAAAAGLTTMAQPLVEKGRAAARLLLAGIQQGQPSRLILPTELKARTSTAPPRQ